jgi:hypothetical protein
MKPLLSIATLLLLCFTAKAQQKGPADNGFSYAKVPAVTRSYSEAEPETDSTSQKKKLPATSTRVINVQSFLAKTNSTFFLEPTQLRSSNEQVVVEGNKKVIYRPAITSNVLYVNEAALKQADKATAAVITYTYQ